MAEIHKKTWPDLFDDVANGVKKFDLRLADFDVRPGDTLVMEEWDPELKIYTDRKLSVNVTYVLKTKDHPFWPEDQVEKYGFQVMQLEDVKIEAFDTSSPTNPINN